MNHALDYGVPDLFVEFVGTRPLARLLSSSSY